MPKNTLHIIKIGGKVMATPELLEAVLHHVVNLPHRKILVHGGGNRASALSERLGIPPRMHEGRRITDASALEVAVMVYAGLVNKQMVASLQAMGCNAIGLSGADGNAMVARKRAVSEVDYGFVGDVQQVNVPLLRNLLDSDLSPVCCAITHDGKGQLFNTNADTIAAHLARALAETYAVRLSYCFERPGVLRDAEDDASLIRRMTHGDYERYRTEGIIHSGMLPKLENAFNALADGVEAVAICDPIGLDGTGGTELVP